MDHSQVSTYMHMSYALLNNSFGANLNEHDFLALPQAFLHASEGQAEYLERALLRTRKVIGLPEALTFHNANRYVNFAVAIAHLVEERMEATGSKNRQAMFTDALKVIALAYTAVSDEDFTDVLKHHSLTSGFLPEKVTIR